MNIFRGADAPWERADPRTFVGPALTQRLAGVDTGVPVMVYSVQFDDGARTNWHAHSGPQWLLVVEGRVRVQTWGGSAHDVGAGDAVMIAPGEKHWHGAAAGLRGVHFAVNVNFKTDWFEPVTDEQYRG